MNNAAANFIPYVETEEINNIVTMSNALTRAGHALNVSEKRLVMLAISKLDGRGKKRLFSVEVITKITAAEYADTYSVSLDTAYSQLKSASKNLYDRTINFSSVTVKGGKKHVDVVNMRWVGQVHYSDTKGFIELYWWPNLLIHLIGLKEQFTKYKLKQATALRSIYSWRMLELFSMCKANKKSGFRWLEISIDEFANAMNATEKQREDFAAIRRKIIEPAVKELTSKDNWIINWKPIKAGRKVKGLSFEFKENEQLQLDIPDPKEED